MTQIIPTLLATTEEKYKEDLDKILSIPELKEGWVQIDLMDNKFVPNLSIGSDILAKYPFRSKKEAQLMVAEPALWIDKLKELGFERIIFPIEVGNTLQLIEQIKQMGLLVGVSLNPETLVEKIIPFVGRIDVVLLMSVHPGFQGQEFIPDTVDKIKQLAALKQKNNFIIEIDGGLKPEIAKQLADAGADVLAVGSKLFYGDIKQNLEQFKKALRG